MFQLTFPNGLPLLRKHLVSDAIRYISGRLKVTHIDPDTGRSLALFLKTSGDIFDVLSLLDGKEHTVFRVVMDKMIVLSIPLTRAREWIYEYPEFNKSFLPYLGNKMRELENFIFFT